MSESPHRYSAAPQSELEASCCSSILECLTTLSSIEREGKVSRAMAGDNRGTEAKRRQVWVHADTEFDLIVISLCHPSVVLVRGDVSVNHILRCDGELGRPYLRLHKDIYSRNFVWNATYSCVTTLNVAVFAIQLLGDPSF